MVYQGDMMIDNGNKFSHDQCRHNRSQPNTMKPVKEDKGQDRSKGDQCHINK